MNDIIAVEAVTPPLHLKFCVNAECLESLTDFDFIADVTSYEMPIDEQLLQYLGKKAKEFKEVFTIDVVDRFVADKLRTDMNNTYDR